MNYKNNIFFYKIALPILFFSLALFFPFFVGAQQGPCSAIGDNGISYSFDISAPTASPNPANAGQPVRLNVVIYGYDPGLTFKWYTTNIDFTQNVLPCTFSTCTYTPLLSASGTETVFVDVLYRGNFACSNSVLIYINTAECTAENPYCGQDTPVGDSYCKVGSKNIWQMKKINYCDRALNKCVSYEKEEIAELCLILQPCQPPTSTQRAQCLKAPPACTPGEICLETTGQTVCRGPNGARTGNDVWEVHNIHTCGSDGKCPDNSTEKEVFVKSCANGEICELGGTCSKVECSKTTPVILCPKDKPVGNPFCNQSNNSLSQKYTHYTCTTNSNISNKCVPSEIEKIITRCEANETCSIDHGCEIAECPNGIVDCPKGEPLGQPFCQANNDSYQKYKNYECVSNKCVPSEKDELVDRCDEDKPCQTSTGKCAEDSGPKGCTKNEDCGEDGFTPEAPECGANNSLYKNYTRHRCVNKTCQHAVSLEPYVVCPQGFTCSGEECVSSNEEPIPTPKTCKLGSFLGCTAGGAFWFNSCTHEKEGIKKSCTVNEECKITSTATAECIPLPEKKVACSSDSECAQGKPAEDIYCGEDKVTLFKATFAYICNNPGKLNSHCAEKDGGKGSSEFLKKCVEYETCEGARKCYSTKNTCKCSEGKFVENSLPMCKGDDPQNVYKFFDPCPSIETSGSCIPPPPVPSYLKKFKDCPPDEKCSPKTGDCAPKIDSNAKYGCVKGQCIPVKDKKETSSSCKGKEGKEGEEAKCEEEKPRCNGNTCVDSNNTEWKECNPVDPKNKNMPKCQHMECDSTTARCKLANGPGKDDPGCVYEKTGIVKGVNASCELPLISRCILNRETKTSKCDKSRGSFSACNPEEIEAGVGCGGWGERCEPFGTSFNCVFSKETKKNKDYTKCNNLDSTGGTNSIGRCEHNACVTSTYPNNLGLAVIVKQCKSIPGPTPSAGEKLCNTLSPGLTSSRECE